MRTWRAIAILMPALVAGCGGKPAYRQPPVEPALVQPAQDDRGMYLDLLRQMQAQGAYFASLAHIDAFRQRFGDTPEVRVLWADALRETGDRAAASRIYQPLTKGPQAAAAWHGLGLIAAAGNDHAQAHSALDSAVRLDPLNTTYLGDLGFALLRAGKVEAARAPLAKAAELAPANHRHIANLAVWALLAGQSAAAERMFQRADLPLSTRQEIFRLAQSLRASWTPAPPVAANAVTAPPTQHTAVAPSARPLPPGSMLDRFTPAPHSQENTP